jgi:hypothetical protein
MKHRMLLLMIVAGFLCAFSPFGSAASSGVQVGKPAATTVAFSQVTLTDSVRQLVRRRQFALRQQQQSKVLARRPVIDIAAQAWNQPDIALVSENLSKQETHAGVGRRNSPKVSVIAFLWIVVLAGLGTYGVMRFVVFQQGKLGASVILTIRQAIQRGVSAIPSTDFKSLLEAHQPSSAIGTGTWTEDEICDDVEIAAARSFQRGQGELQLVKTLEMHKVGNSLGSRLRGLRIPKSSVDDRKKLAKKLGVGLGELELVNQLRRIEHSKTQKEEFA